MIWWMLASIGGCLLDAEGAGARYIEMMVMPLENCSTYFLEEVRP
jgi:hypothetical protein